ncbi:MAG TPA: BamA/TamA family outer membrane protein [Caldimonas sp.]|nr:BamA/TamA family outer membrane protein [Caldimonas sp.]
MRMPSAGRALRRVLQVARSVACAAPALAQASVNEYAEDRFAEAEARPAPAVQKGSWVVVPIPVANPTLGNGLQVAALYLHAKGADDANAPSDTSGVGGMATDNGARLLGFFHDGSYAQDRFRVSGFVGSGKFELKFFGIGNVTLDSDHALPYRIDGTIGQVRAAVRMPRTQDWFVGLSLLYIDATVTVETSQVLPPLPDVPLSFRNTGIGPYVQYDSRDSNYYPRSGQYFRATWMKFTSEGGLHESFDKGDAFYNAYLPVRPSSVLALRTRLQTSSGETPFFQLPTLDMRGFSRDRYRDNFSLSATAEWREKLATRWGAMGFVEAGRVAPSFGDLGSARTITSFGGGVRWRPSADKDLNLGVDFAISTDDRAVFIQIGEKF